jgi:hypothetical protein
MKAKLLSFIFKNFSESGLFKGLRAKKIKKSVSLVTRLTGCGPNVSNSVQPHSVARAAAKPSE